MTTIGPGATIGILGGGQLARMLAFDARRMGYRVAIVDPDPQGPAAQVADVAITGAFDDLTAALALAEQSDVITLDTEHVPAALLERLQMVKPVRPSAKVLRVVQDRLEQRTFLAGLGAPQARYAPVDDREGLQRAGELVGFPGILKTRRWGYDGKGQAHVSSAADLELAWRTIGEAPAVLEAFIDFDREISVLLARALDGSIRFHPITENVHRRHILHISRVPARIPADVASAAEALGGRIASALGPMPIG